MRRSSLLSLVLLCSLTAAAAPAPAASGWEDPAPLHVREGGGPYDSSARGAVDGLGRVTAAWEDQLSGTLQVRTRSAAGVWGPVQTMGGSVQFARAQVAANAAGDTAVIFLACESERCALNLAYRGRMEPAFAEPVVVAASLLNSGVPRVAVAPDGAVTVTWHAEGVLARRYSPGALGLTPAGDAVRVSSEGSDVGESSVVVRADGAPVVAYAALRPDGDGLCRAVRLVTGSADGSFGAPVDVMPGNCVADDGSFAYESLAGLAPLGPGVLVIAQRFVDAAEDTNETWAVEAPATGEPRRVRLAQESVVAAHPESGLPAVATSPNGDALFAGAGSQSEHPSAFVRAPDGTWSGDAHLPQLPGSGANVSPAIGPGGRATLVGTTELDGQSRNRVVALHRPRGGAWSDGVTISRPGRAQSEPAVYANEQVRGVALWTSQDLQGTGQGSIDASASRNERPTAGFSVAPDAPKAGEDVTFASTATDAEGPIAATAWDLDDDGSFDDASGPTATARFASAGSYTVELRVTDGEGETAVASREVTVGAAPPSTTPDEQGTPSSPGSPGTVAPAPPAAEQQPTTPSAARFGFVVTRQVDTTGRRAMPAVTGRDVDAARSKVLRALVHADITTRGVRKPAAVLGRRPGGGSWRIGDVIGQSPAAGAQRTTSTTAQAPVELVYWSGDRSDEERCDDLERALKGDALQAALDQLTAAGCARKPDIVVAPAKKAVEPEVSRAAGDDGSKLTVAVPTDPAKLDITTWKTSGVVGSPNPGPAAGDFSLTAGQDNVLGVLLHDRAQRRLGGAKVRLDLHEVGGKDVERRVADGVFATTVRPERAGTIHVLSEWADAKGERIYGHATFEVVERTAPSFVTALGKTYVRETRGHKRYVAQAPKGARAASVGQFFTWVGDCLRSLGGQVAATASATAEGIVRTARSLGAVAMQLHRSGAAGGQATVTRSTGGVWIVGPNGIVAAGSGNIVAAGSGNIVAAGSGNIVAAGSGNLTAAGILSDNGLGLIGGAAGNLIADGKAGLIDGAAGNLVALPDGGRVPVPSRLLSDNGLGIVAAGSGNVLAVGR